MKTNASYLVFLDVDGVFTSARVEMSDAQYPYLWSKFDPVAVEFMNRIHDKHDVEFVLSSTWRDNLKMDDNSLIWVITAFRNAGFRGAFAPTWKVNPEDEPVMLYQKGRAHEIKHYIENYTNNLKDYIIFDDNDYGFDSVLGVKRLVRTDTDNGILVKHMKHAKSIMGNWYRDFKS